MLRLSVVPLALAILEATSMQLPPCRVNIALGQNGLDILSGFLNLGDNSVPVYGVQDGIETYLFGRFSAVTNVFVIGSDYTKLPFLIWTNDSRSSLNYSVTASSSDLAVSSPLNLGSQPDKGRIFFYNGSDPSEKYIPNTEIIAPCDGTAGQVGLVFTYSVTGSNCVGYRLELDLQKICLDCKFRNSCRPIPTTLVPTPTGAPTATSNGIGRVTDDDRTILLITISGSIGFLLFLLTIFLIIIIARKRQSRNREAESTFTLPVPQPKESKQDQWTIAPSSLLFQEKLGEGAFGNIYKALLNTYDVDGVPSKTTVAVKCLKESAEKAQLTMMQKEIGVMKAMKDVEGNEPHPHILQMIGHYSGNSLTESVMLVLEIADLGNLLSYVRANRPKGNGDSDDDEEDINSRETKNYRDQKGSVSSTVSVASHFPGPDDFALECLQIAENIASGMAWMEANHFVHRDLAARNVLLTRKDDRKIAKISDFGMGREVYESGMYKWQKGQRVPVKWWSPESLELYECTTKGDVWSYGVVLWEMATLGRCPYPGIAPVELLPKLKAGYRLPKPESCSDEAYALMSSCWKYCPKKRPKFRELLCQLQEMMSSERNYLPVLCT